MNDEERRRRTAETATMADALVDDLTHIRKVLADEKKLRGDVRRLAHIARRLLVDGSGGDLQRVAAPRIGRVVIRAPANEDFYQLQECDPGLVFAISGGVEVAGVSLRWMEMSSTPSEQRTADVDAGKQQDLRLSQFLDQRVVFHGNIWATRRDVIKYVANVGHAIHSGKIESVKERALSRVANSTSIGIQLFDAPTRIEMPQERECDGVSYEMLCTLGFVSSSPDVLRLEEYIRSGP